jgi:hypothetical protein
MELALVQKAPRCRNFALALVRVQAFGSPPTARVLGTYGAVRARAQPWKSVLSLDAVLTFGSAELLNTSCA